MFTGSTDSDGLEYSRLDIHIQQDDANLNGETVTRLGAPKSSLAPIASVDFHKQLVIKRNISALLVFIDYNRPTSSRY